MATSGSITSITTTYAGEFAGKYVAAALLSAPTIEKGGVEILPNIKFKQVMQKMALTDVLSDASCDFTRTDDAITLTERVLEVKDLQVNLELDICRAPAGALQISSGEYDGITTQLAVDAGLPAAQEIAGTTVTAANVIDELGSIVDAIPSTVYGREDLHIYISQNIARAYVRALGGFAALTNVAGTENVASRGANGVDNRGTLWYGMGQDLAFDGVKLFVANGLADNTAIAAQKSNLFFGCSLNSDLQEVKLLDMSDLDGSNNCRVIMRMACGAQYAIVDDIVTYGIVNSAN